MRSDAGSVATFGMASPPVREVPVIGPLPSDDDSVVVSPNDEEVTVGGVKPVGVRAMAATAEGRELLWGYTADNLRSEYTAPVSQVLAEVALVRRSQRQRRKKEKQE